MSLTHAQRERCKKPIQKGGEQRMKRILVSLMTMALIGALVTGGIYAYFSDTETSTGNTFTAGTLDLEVNDENPWTSTGVTVANMEPGVAATPVDISCENVGTLTGDLYLRITSVTDTGGTINEPECYAEGGTWTSPSGPCTGNTAVDDISTLITLSCQVDGSPVAGLNGVLLSAVPGTWTLIQDDLAGSGGTITLSIGGTLSSGAANEYQGDVSTFTIELYLAQDGQTPS
jgi:predicted ribosomally synthesized peptide with SipW-like signal peptide